MQILNDIDLFNLTGYKIGFKQTVWIEKNFGFKPPRKADGHPYVTWEQLNGGSKTFQANRPVNLPTWSILP
jgi:hypothetical protein